jgi:peptide/nickel transport system permease protein
MEEVSTDVVSIEPGAPGQELGDAAAPEMPGRRRVSRHVWILRRVAIGVVTLLFVSIIVFAATQALPGNAARQILGRNQSGAAFRALEHQLGLNQPIVTQYLTWASHVVSGNLGTSFTENLPVSKVIGSAVANSAVLVVLATVISVFVSVLIGVATAARRDGLVDNAFSGFTFLFTAVPEFIIGILLVMLFATTVFHVLPAVSLIPPGSGALSHPNVYVLPVATLVLAITPYLGRLVGIDDRRTRVRVRANGAAEGHD